MRRWWEGGGVQMPRARVFLCSAAFCMSCWWGCRRTIFLVCSALRSLTMWYTAKSERLTKVIPRRRVHRNDRADTDDLFHVAVGENGRFQREDTGKLYFLDQLLSGGSAAGSAVVLLCVASQVW